MFWMKEGMNILTFVWTIATEVLKAAVSALWLFSHILQIGFHLFTSHLPVQKK